jgi:tetratricopeptide (TPR) repeat protein
MFGIRPAGGLVAAFGLLPLIFPGFVFAQAPASGSVNTQPAPTPSQENKGGLSVMVRTSNGTAVDTLAVVTLYDASGQTITSKTTADSRTSFVPLGAGSYIIDIDAPGFAKTRREAKITGEEGEQLLIVTLRPDTGSGVTYSVSSAVTLPPKPQKEVSKGLEALRAGKFDEAIKHLEAAQHMAPKEAEIASLLGSVYEKKSDLASARKYWDQAIQLNPKHLASLLACGDLLLRQKDVAGARKYLEQAVEAGPNSWRAHSLLAAALLQQHSYVEAVSHAERAIDIGKSEANSARLTLGQALAFQHKNEQAITVLEAYIAGAPSKSMADAAQNMIARLKDANSASPAATTPLVDLSSGNTANKSGGGEEADTPLSAAVMSWLPPDVDAAVPPVEPSVTCALDDVLKKASAVVAGLPKIVDRYAATEVFHQENINGAGYAESVADMSFNYLASVRDIKSEKYGEALDVQEYRNGSTGTEMFPNHEGSVGLPSIVLIFHPLLISDFEMKCEGLSRAHGDFAWQVSFRQRGDKESRIRRYRLSGHVYPIALKGRAWIDANTFQIVRLETDLREPHPEIQLNAEHLVMEYGPVKFQKRNEELWLPASADYYAIRRGKRFHRRHAFTNYILFSVDMDQKIGLPPKEKTSASPPEDKKSSN